MNGVINTSPSFITYSLSFYFLFEQSKDMFQYISEKQHSRAYYSYKTPSMTRHNNMVTVLSSIPVEKWCPVAGVLDCLFGPIKQPVSEVVNIGWRPFMYDWLIEHPYLVIAY